MARLLGRRQTADGQGAEGAKSGVGSGKLGGGKREADRYQFSVSPPDEGAKSHVERLSVERPARQAAGLSPD